MAALSARPLDRVVRQGVPVLTADPNALQDVTEAIRATLQNVNRLVAEGLVEKRPDPADGRARRIHLTDTGRALLEAAASCRATSWVR